MILKTKRRVMFNIYARNFNFHNEMEATITLTKHIHNLCTRPICVASFFVPWNTPGMHIIYPKQENAVVCVRGTAIPQKKWNLLHTKRQMSHDRFSSKNLTSYTQFIPQASISRPVIGPCRRKGDDMTCDCHDTRCQRQEILASPSSRWFLLRLLDVTILLPSRLWHFHRAGVVARVQII